MPTATRPADECRRLLKRYLSRYFRAKEKRAALDRRLMELRAELKNPGITRPAFGSVPTSGKGRVSNGSASLTYKIGDIEDKIEQQIAAETQSIVDIMEVLSYLPSDSVERDILEYRHIDCMSWNRIMDVVHLSRSPCFEHYNRGLDNLLSHAEVRKLLDAYAEQLRRQKRGV